MAQEPFARRRSTAEAAILQLYVKLMYSHYGHESHYQFLPYIQDVCMVGIVITRARHSA
jgi:hypothetical protein